MTDLNFGCFIIGYFTGVFTLILIKLVIQLHETNLLFKSKEAEPVDVVERIRHIEEKHMKDKIDQIAAKKVEAED